MAKPVKVKVTMVRSVGANVAGEVCWFEMDEALDLVNKSLAVLHPETVALMAPPQPTDAPPADKMVRTSKKG